MNKAYDLLGKEPGIRALVDRFYDLMDTRADAVIIRAMHPDDLSDSKDKLFWFLVGRFGGPPMYEERVGHPRLRARHMPFAVDSAAAAAWMACMNQALDEQVADDAVRQAISGFFGQIAEFMKNR